MPRTICIAIELDDDDFRGPKGPYSLSRVLGNIAGDICDRIENLHTDMVLHTGIAKDRNGNKVGNWTLGDQ